MKIKRAASIPLVTHDPYFSIWSNSDKLNESDTIFWNGLTKKTYGVIFADGVCYSFLGDLGEGEFVNPFK